MLRAILFDLDGTLLGNAPNDFVPAYFRALTSYMAHMVPPDRMMQELLRGTHMMDHNDGHGSTNADVFSAYFYPALGFDQHTLEPSLERYYREEFPKLRPLTRRLPEARGLVEQAARLGLQVVVATDPFFPRIAIEERLAWAGVPVAELDYALVTSYEIMHATKSSTAYYREIAERLGREPSECMMVGDDWKRDMVPAAELGMRLYWIAEPGAVPPDPGIALDGWGALADVSSLLGD